MTDGKPNIATMEPQDYIEARIEQIPDTAKKILGLDDPANHGQISHMLSVEYIRLRHGMLEQNCLQFMRRYMGAMNALVGVVGECEATRMFLEAMKNVPEDIREVPQI